MDIAIAVENKSNPPKNYLQLVFNLILIYYWLLSYMTITEENGVGGTYKYFLYTVPITLFVLIFFYKILTSKIYKYKFYLLMFIVFVFWVSIFRSDFASINTYLLQVATLLIILNSSIKISLKLVNSLFILSILGAIISYYTGNSNLGFLPGQSFNDGNIVDEDMFWRVSLFPFVADSGFFSLIVILLNVKFNSRIIYRNIILLFAIYFFVLSGLRSSFICLLFFIFFEIIRHRVDFYNRPFYRLYNYLALLLFLIIINLNSLLLVFSSSSNPVVNQILFRNEEGITDSDDLKKAIFRTIIWTEHIDIFVSNPFIGIGTFQFKKIAKSPLVENTPTSGSESPLTELFARLGLVTVFYILFIVAFIKRLLISKNDFGYFIVLLILIIMLTYGSFMTPYSMIFLLLWASTNGVE